jgi:hypothetical protein
VRDKREANARRSLIANAIGVRLDEDCIGHRVLIVMERSLFLKRPLSCKVTPSYQKCTVEAT